MDDSLITAPSMSCSGREDGGICSSQKCIVILTQRRASLVAEGPLACTQRNPAEKK